jgi:hypothetical protein
VQEYDIALKLLLRNSAALAMRETDGQRQDRQLAGRRASEAEPPRGSVRRDR